MIAKIARGTPTPIPILAPSDSGGAGSEVGELVKPEETTEMDVTIVIRLVVGLDGVGLELEVIGWVGVVGIALWAENTSASVRRDVGTSVVGGNHGVRFGDTMFTSSGSGPQP